MMVRLREQASLLHGLGCQCTRRPGLKLWWRLIHTVAKAISDRTSSAHGNEMTPTRSSSRPPNRPPPAMATFQEVVSMACITSTCSPAESAAAVSNSVAEPPNDSPHTATQAQTTHGDDMSTANTSAVNANTARLINVSLRNQRSTDRKSTCLNSSH